MKPSSTFTYLWGWLAYTQDLNIEGDLFIIILWLPSPLSFQKFVLEGRNRQQILK